MLLPAADSTRTRCMSTTATVGGVSGGPATTGAAAGAAAGVCAKALGRTVRAPTSATPKTKLLRRMKQNLLEMRSKVEIQNLSLIQALLQEGIGDIDAHKTERRLPGHADTGRGAEREALENTLRAGSNKNAVDVDRLVAFLDATQGAEIAEAEGLDAVFLRQAQRNARLKRTGIVIVAAERIVCLDVARADTGDPEAAQT